MEEKINDRLFISISQWYRSVYSTDGLKDAIIDYTTFSDVYNCLFRTSKKFKKCNVYDCIGVEDSVIRERVFSKLAEILDVDYDVIYNQWLNTDID